MTEEIIILTEVLAVEKTIKKISLFFDCCASLDFLKMTNSNVY